MCLSYKAHGTKCINFFLQNKLAIFRNTESPDNMHDNNVIMYVYKCLNNITTKIGTS